jgi:prepilin-type N-terminal cleavage/methylation domain-containing protein
MHMNKRQSGFTLIEIAIVLVIIGLLLGGVLKGQALINSAKVRSLNNNVDGITAAWFAFQDRYRMFPGDMTQAMANSQIAAPPAITGGGNGNGIVLIGEGGFLWQHLAAAGFISGSFPTGAAPATVYDCIVANCPDNRFGTGFVIASAAITFPAPASHHLYTGSNIPVAIVAELDRKIDDGLPNTGSVLNGFNNGAAATCRTGAGVAGTYNVTAASADCGLATNSL